MTIGLKIINPINYSGWNKLLLSHPKYSFFHSSHWARVLCDSYNYKPLYFTLVDMNMLKVLVPLMEIKSYITGQRGVSLPFSDFSHPIIHDGIQFEDVIRSIVNYGKHESWKYIEIRDDENYSCDLTPSEYYYGHTLYLSGNDEKTFARFRSSTRRNIKKAVIEGVEVKITNSLESIEEFCRLNCITRKMHGLPPQPYYFFKKIYEHIISKKHGFLVLASYKEKTIAGSVYFHFGRKAIYKYGASDKKYQYLRANNLVMWEAIKWYSRNGFKSLCFGRTEPENTGLRQFKAGWGTEEKFIKYYRYNFNKNAFINTEFQMTGFYNKVFKEMPIPLLKLVGSMLYKHTG